MNLLLSATGGLLEKVAAKWQGLLTIFTALTVGFVAGAGLIRTVVEAQELPGRVTALEDWQATHDDVVTGPGLARIAVLEGQNTEILLRVERIESWVYDLYCLEFPGECRGVPR